MVAAMLVLGDEPGLLEGFREGREDALGRVYRTCVRAIDRYVRAQARAVGYLDLAQPSAVADIIQETFIRAFSPAARAAYDGRRDFGPFLITIARNCFIDALRTRGREVLKEPDDLSLVIDETPAEADACFDPRITAVLTGYLRGLPTRLASVYEQRFVLGRSQAEASAALGLSRRTLRTAEHHLRRGLRHALRRAGISLRDLKPSPEDLSTKNRLRAVARSGA